MDYTTTISKRRRHNKVEYLARLRYYDAESGARKEKSRSAPTISEAERLLRDMEDEFESGGQTAMESDHVTFAELAKHCKETRYCEAQFDSEGRKESDTHWRCAMIELPSKTISTRAGINRAGQLRQERQCDQLQFTGGEQNTGHALNGSLAVLGGHVCGLSPTADLSSRWAAAHH